MENRNRNGDEERMQEEKRKRMQEDDVAERESKREGDEPK